MRLPLAVLTGFLGSGKTTLLKCLLTHPAMARTAVVINEFGDIGLDDAFMERTDEDTVVLASGCVCCTVRSDLPEALARLRGRVRSGKIPAFERVVLETTGLADPAPIVHTLMTHARLARQFRLENVIATVDAQHGLRQLDERFEPAKQAAVADRIVLTKTDIAPAADVETLRGRLRELNPSAPILPAIHGDVAPQRLLGAGLYDPRNRTPDVRRWLDEESYRAAPFDDHEVHAHSHARSDVPGKKRHRHGIDSFCLTFLQPLEWSSLAEAFSLLIQMHGDKLLRVKGLVNARAEHAPIAIHGVQHVFYPPTRLGAWPSDDRRTRIVFIVRDLGADTVRQLFSPFVAGRASEADAAA
ncbi:MAG: GTP-binding protein [Burkholderiales bacterium]